MGYDIGPSIGITGEKEFKEAMASINNEFKMLGSEMKLAVSQFDKNDKSTAALTAQNQVLGKEIDSQKGKIALLTTQYDKQNSTLATLKDKLDATKLAFGADSVEVAKAQKEYDKQNRAVMTLQTQLNNATTGLNNMNRQLESNNQTIKDNSKDMGEFSEKIKAMGAAVGVGMAAVGTAFLGAVVAGTKMSDDLTKALNGVQASTGVTDEAMAGMKDTMLEIYNDNFGENFQEIGAAMATVAQQTELSGEALKKTTENALLLKDTFGLEVEDSIKGANQVMKQFGVDSETAYNLIAQGAQSGLDSNGDLLDTLNEYSGTFKVQGFSAEEMFNMLSNASKSGIRDVDLAADAIKEFGIRSKDGSTTSAAGFEALGLSAGEMTKAFGVGGETAKEAFIKTTTALLAMKDPVAQNAAGVALFGTQWEDLGVKGVTALVNTKGSITTTTNALKTINDVKYNTFSESIEGIKRQLLTGLVLPLGQEVLPKMNEFGNYLKANLPAIIESVKPVINGLLDAFKLLADNMNIIIPVLAGVVAGIVAFNVITAVSGLIKAFQLATEGATIAQWAMNLAMSANPIGLVAAAIAVLVAAGVALYMNWDTIVVKVGELWTSITTKFEEIKNSVIKTLGEWWTSMSTWFDTSKASIVTKLSGWWASIETWYNNTKASIIAKLAEWWASIGAWYDTSKDNIIVKLADWLLSILKWYIDTGVEIVTKLGEWWTSLKTWYDDTKNNVVLKLGEWWASIETWYNDTKTNVVGKLGEWWTSIETWYNDTKTDIITKLGEWWTSISQWYDDTKESMKTKWDEIKAAVSDKIVELKTAAMEKFDDIATAIGLVWTGIKDGIIGTINTIIGTINGFINHVNSIKIQIPVVTIPLVGTFGGGVIGMPQIPTIPLLAEGGIFNRPTLGIFGEAGEEAALPISKLDGIVARALVKANKKMGMNGGVTQHLTINSPTALSPSETARQVKNASRLLALEW